MSNQDPSTVTAALATDDPRYFAAVQAVKKAIRAGSSFYGELTWDDAERGVDALLAAGWRPPDAE